MSQTGGRTARAHSLDAVRMAYAYQQSQIRELVCAHVKLRRPPLPDTGTKFGGGGGGGGGGSKAIFAQHCAEH